MNFNLNMNVNVTVNNPRGGAGEEHRRTTMASKTEVTENEGSEHAQGLPGASTEPRSDAARRPKTKSITEVSSRHYLGSKSSGAQMSQKLVTTGRGSNRQSEGNIKMEQQSN